MICIMVGSLKTSIMIIIVFEQLSRDKSDISLNQAYDNYQLSTDLVVVMLCMAHFSTLLQV